MPGSSVERRLNGAAVRRARRVAPHRFSNAPPLWGGGRENKAGVTCWPRPRIRGHVSDFLFFFFNFFFWDVFEFGFVFGVMRFSGYRSTGQVRVGQRTIGQILAG